MEICKIEGLRGMRWLAKNYFSHSQNAVQTGEEHGNTIFVKRLRQQNSPEMEAPHEHEIPSYKTMNINKENTCGIPPKNRGSYKSVHS